MQQILKHSILAMACLGMLIPQSALMAAGPQAPMTGDVVLGQGGLLQGQVVNVQGKALAEMHVSIRLNEQEVAAVKTDEAGFFAVGGVRPGVYHIAAGQGHGVFRVWSSVAAPPTAQNTALIVTTEQVVRGQDPRRTLVWVTLTGLAVGGAYALGYNIGKDDAEEDDDQS